MSANDQPAVGSTTEQLRALSPSLKDVLETLQSLANAQAKQSTAQAHMMEQQATMLGKLGQVIVQLNKHSLFLVQHERAISRCLGCRNYAPLDSLGETHELPLLTPEPLRTGD